MNLLDKVITHSVEKTERTHIIRIKGENRLEPIYKIKLSDLFFNDQNDRIATFIEKYKFDNKNNAIDRTDKDKYNDLIHNFIIESNPDSIEKTKTNISIMGQRQPAIVLSDGRIIDGNRRFACLRELYKKNNDEKYNYLDAVIIKEELEHNKREIKILELEIQHGEEEKVDYDPIEKLVGIYNDIHKNKLLDVATYAKSVNKKESEINKELEIAILISDFLKLFGFDEQFHLAKELKLDGPIREIHSALKLIDDVDKKERFKKTAFALLISKKDGDKTRYFRELKKIADNVDSFLESTEDETIDIIGHFSKNNSDESLNSINDKVVASKISSLYENEISSTIHEKMDKAINLQNLKETKDKPKSLVEKCIDNLKSIDLNVLKINNSDISGFDKLLDELIEQILKIKEKINE